MKACDIDIGIFTNPAVVEDLEHSYMTTSEAAVILNCKRGTIIKYVMSKPPVLGHQGEGKILVRRYDVYRAIGQHGKKGNLLAKLYDAKLAELQKSLENEEEEQ